MPHEKYTQKIRNSSEIPHDSGRKWGRVFIENKYDFLDLSHFSLQWHLVSSSENLSDGILATGEQVLPAIQPGAIVPIDLGFSKSPDSTQKALKKALEEDTVVLQLQIRLTHSCSWAPAGHIVAKETIILSERATPIQHTGIQHIGVTKSNKLLTPDFDEQGILVSLLNEKGQQLLRSPLLPHLFRVPTQNDGLKNFMKFRGNPDFSFYTNKVMYAWLDAGLQAVTLKLLEKNDEGQKHWSRHVMYTTTGIDAGTFIQRWEQLDAATIHADFTFMLAPELPELGRVGIQCTIAPFSSVEWFGRGPHEAYSDRKAAAHTGRWRAELPQLVTPYILPQENGNRHQTHWLHLWKQNESTPLLCIEGLQLFDFSVSPYTDTELWEARHWDSLPDFTTATQRGLILNLDAAQRGVGTATCGPDTLEEYRLRPGVYRLSLLFTRAY
jgi:beta-galactosidase